MSTDEPPVTLIKWCKERSGIRLTKEYVKEWHQARSSPISDIESAYKELVSDFLNRDITTTSEPVIQKEFGQLSVDTFPLGHLRQGGGVVLQIQDAIDIGISTLTLLKSLNTLRVVRHTYRENDDTEFPRSMLRWTLTDGHKQIQAMEIERISGIDLKTPFGTKILIDNCQVKRNMLLLTQNNVKILGGDVPRLYGGNMVAELERRFKLKLGLLDEPETPTPNDTPLSATENNTNRAFEGDDSYMSERTYVNQEITPESLVNEIEEYEDDYEYDDMDFDGMNDIEPEENNTNSNQRNVPTQEDYFDPFDNEDDFMEPPSLSTNIEQTQTRKPEQTQNSNDNTPQPPTSTHNSMEIPETHNEIPEINLEDEENSHQDDSTNLIADEDGKARCSFEILKKAVKAMEKGEYTGNMPDSVITKVKCETLGRFKMYSALKFSLEMGLVDPNNPGSEPLRAYLNNDVIVDLIGVENQELVDIFNRDGQKSVVAKIFKPFMKKVVGQVANAEIDLSVLESTVSRTVNSKLLLPNIRKFDICS